MSTLNNNLRGERGLMRPQVLVIFAMLAIAAFAFQVRDSLVAEAVLTTLPPTANGTYGQWDTGDFGLVNEDVASAVCNSDDFSSENSNTERDSYVVSLSSIPNGATINGISVRVRDRADETVGGTYASFIRLNGTDSANSATHTTSGATSGAACPGDHTDSFSVVPFVKGAGTTLEIGVIKLGSSSPASNVVRVGAIAAIIDYTVAPANNPPTTPSPTEPSDNDVVNTLTPAFSWTAASDPNGDDFHYELQISTDCTNSPFSNDNQTDEIVLPESANPAENHTLTAGQALDNDTDYCWRVRAVDDNDSASAWSAQNDFETDLAAVAAVPNPALGNSCGVDLALVIDSSESVDSGELTSMKTAFTNFATFLLNSTPSRVSVVEFDYQAQINQAMTGNLASVTAGINATSINSSIPANQSEYTNWQDALIKAQTSLTAGDASNARPNIVLMTTDGDPTISNGALGSPTTSQPNQHFAPALSQANTMKTLGGAAGPTYIITLGIGTTGADSIQRLNGISTVADTYTSANFATLQTSLQQIILALCAGTINVQKVIDADGSLATTTDRTAGANFTFNVAVSGGDNVSPNVATDTNGAGVIQYNVTISGPDATVTLTEAGETGYALIGINCVGGTNAQTSVPNANAIVTLNTQGTATCTFINTLVPTLTLVKSLPNNSGGTAVASSWTLSANTGGGAVELSGAGGASGTVPAGTYDLSETGSVPGYTNGTTWVCTGTGTQNDADTVTLANGQSATCTITNDDQPGTLILRKVVTNNSGGTANAGQWTLQASGPTPVSSSGQTDDDADALEAQYGFLVNAGSYTLSESGGPGGYSAGNWACTVNGQEVAGANDNPVAVGLGQTVVCTIVNDDQQANLTLRKVVSGSPSTNAQGWTLSADGPNGFAFDSVAANDADADVSEAQYAVGNVNAGIYTLSESGPSGFSASAWSCTNGVSANAQGQITLGNGVTTVCTITNNAQPANLTLVKNVIANNGGNNNPAQWTLTADQQGGNGLLSGAGGASGEIPAGTYDLSESGPGAPAWSASAWSCVGQDVGWSAQNPGVITLDPGESAVCTITNDDQPGTLIVVKTLINDDGGPLTDESDFSFAVNGGTPVVFEADGQNNLTVNAGTYSVTEVADSRYNTSYQNCTNVVVANGGSATCTITNNDKPSLTLIKHVDNGTTGGTATAASFTLTADGAGNDFSDTGLEAGRTYLLTGLSDTFALSESGHDGYSASAWSCVGGTQNGASVTVTDGNSAVCSITNTAVAATLWLVKNVVNDDGGSQPAAAWTLTATGPASFSTSGQTDETVDSPDATASYDFSVPVGSYALGESGPAGYSASAWRCSIDQQPVATPVQIALGQTVVCSITNDDQASSLALVKTVVNDEDGAATADNWTLTANGNAGQLLADADALEATYVFAGIPAGLYDLAEAGVGDITNGYTTKGWNCSEVLAEGESLIDFSDGATLDDLEIGNGQVVICRITNDDPDILPALQVVKEADVNSVPETGGDVTYTVTVTNTSAVELTLNSLSDDIFGDLNGNGDCSVPQTIAAGGSYQCSFTETLGGEPGTHTNEVCAEATDAQQNEASGCDDEDVEIDDVLPDITVVKTALDTEAEADGENIEFRVDVTNNTDEEFTVTSMVDDKFGEILDGSNPLIIATDCTAETIAPLGTYTCTFTAEVSGEPESTHVNVVTVTGGDDDGNEDSDSDDAEVTLLDDPISVSVDKSSPDAGTLDEDDVVEFVVVVTNTSDEPVRIVSLTDDIYGDITSVHGDIESTDCAEGVVIPAGGDYECSFEALVAFSGDKPHINTVTVGVEELEGGDTASDSDSDTIRFESSPPSIDPTPSPSPTVAPAVLSSGPPVSEVLPARLPATGAGPLSGGMGWLFVLGLGFIGLGAAVVTVTRLAREGR